MSNLYEITRTIESLLEQAIGSGGEILDEQLDAELDALHADRDKRVLDIACAIIDYRAEAAKIAERARALQDWAASIDAKAERLRRYIAQHIPEGHKVSDDRVRLSWRKSERAVLDCDPVQLPERLQRVTVAADLATIKHELKCGDLGEYAHLETHHNLQVK